MQPRGLRRSVASKQAAALGVKFINGGRGVEPEVGPLSDKWEGTTERSARPATDC